MVICAMVAGLLAGLWYLAGFLLIGTLLVGLNRRLANFAKLFAVGILPTAAIIFVLDVIAMKGGQLYWHWAFLSVTEFGLAAAVRFTSRFLIIGVGVMVIMHLGDMRHFARDLEQRGVSSKATYVIQATGLMLPQLVGRGAVILDAQRARGVETDANIFVRLKALLPSAAPLILSSLTGMVERAVSLEARGMTMTGPRTSLLQVQNTPGDKVLLWGSLAGLAVYLVVRFW